MSKSPKPRFKGTSEAVAELHKAEEAASMAVMLCHQFLEGRSDKWQDSEAGTDFIAALDALERGRDALQEAGDAMIEAPE